MAKGERMTELQAGIALGLLIGALLGKIAAVEVNYRLWLRRMRKRGWDV